MTGSQTAEWGIIREEGGGVVCDQIIKEFGYLPEEILGRKFTGSERVLPAKSSIRAEWHTDHKGPGLLSQGISALHREKGYSPHCTLGQICVCVNRRWWKWVDQGMQRTSLLRTAHRTFRQSLAALSPSERKTCSASGTLLTAWLHFLSC